jgi:hypothetical protein
MNEDEIRSLVRAAIARHLGSSGSTEATHAHQQHPHQHMHPHPHQHQHHIAFARYLLPRAADDSRCLIEPAVACTHCGYCQCHGH